jgi:hypothetical protein
MMNQEVLPVERRESLNGMSIIARTKEAIYLRIPKELQQPAGKCTCPHCKGADAFWDTLAVPIAPPQRNDTAWTVHMPDPTLFRRLVA